MEHNQNPFDDKENEEDDEDQPLIKIEKIFKLDKKESIQEEKESILDTILKNDKAPELEAEASVANLNPEEIEDVSQILAEERLEEVSENRDNELDPVELAAEQYLENVISTGNAQEAYDQTILELNLKEDENEKTIAVDQIDAPENQQKVYQDRAYENSNPQNNIQPVVQPEALILDSFNNQDQNQEKVKENKRKKENHKVIAFLSESLLSRREPRLKSKKSSPELNQNLTKQVEQIQSTILTKEQKIRTLTEKLDILKKASLPATYEKVKEKRQSEIIKPILSNENIKLFEEDPKLKVNLKDKIKVIRHLNTKELLSVASKIKVENIPLKKAYMDRIITEKGLRRIVEAYFRGMNVKKVFKRELIQKEIDFERDPALRDQGVDLGEFTERKTSIEDLVEQAGINWKNQETEYLPLPKKESKLASIKIKDKTQKNFKLLDFILFSIILILMATVLIIFISKG